MVMPWMGTRLAVRPWLQSVGNVILLVVFVYTQTGANYFVVALLCAAPVKSRLCLSAHVRIGGETSPRCRLSLRRLPSRRRPPLAVELSLGALLLREHHRLPVEIDSMHRDEHEEHHQPPHYEVLQHPRNGPTSVVSSLPQLPLLLMLLGRRVVLPLLEVGRLIHVLLHQCEPSHGDHDEDANAPPDRCALDPRDHSSAALARTTLVEAPTSPLRMILLLMMTEEARSRLSAASQTSSTGRVHRQGVYVPYHALCH
jgi:hypothetical protein